jgi:Family of unknown function (DUF6288)
MYRSVPLLMAGLLLGSWCASPQVIYRQPSGMTTTPAVTPTPTPTPTPASAAPSIKERRAAATVVLDLLAKNLTNGQLDYHFNSSGEGVLLGAAGLAFIGSGSTIARGPYQPALGRVFERVLRIMEANDFPLQPTWGCAQSAIFLAELHRTAPSEKQPAILALLAKYADKLVKSQTSRGGWCHGFEDVKNSLNYDDLMATTVMALQGLGMARREGVAVPPMTIDQGVRYIENSSDVGAGHIGYSPRSGQKGMGGSGRTAGGLLALSACGYGHSPLALSAATYVRKSFVGSEMNAGHASAQLSQSWAAWWAGEAELYPEFWAGQGAFIMERRKPTGGFHCAPSDGNAGDPPAEQGDMANALHALMLVAGDGLLVAGEARTSPQAAITAAIDLAAGWGAGAPECLTSFAALRTSDHPLTAVAIAKELASTLKALAKIQDARTAPAILTLLGPEPTYSARYDEKSRVIRVEVALPAIRTTGIAKATLTIAHDNDLMRAKPAKKSLIPGTEPSTADLSISVRPEVLDARPLQAEVRWNLAGLEHLETFTITVERPVAGK